MRQSELDEYQYSGEYPWRDEEIMRELYINQGLSGVKIAERLGCSPAVANDWLHRHDIETRSPGGQVKYDQLRDREWLQEQYHEKGLMQAEIGDKIGCGRGVVGDWMRKHGIETDPERRLEVVRDVCRVERASFRTENGYGRWQVRSEKTSKHFKVHRLLAVAEFGIEAVKEKETHHINHIPFDNRPENIMLMTNSDHYSYHRNVEEGNREPMWKDDPQYHPE